MHAYLRLMRFDRPIGTLLLLWPTLWALWFAASGVPDLKVLTIFVLGVIVMRAAGCVINDYADRNIDPYVERTKNRPLAAREVTKGEALVLFFALLVMAFGLVWMTNRLTVYLAVVGAFLAITYPFLKRYTYLPQIYLGVTFGWAIPMAYAAQSGSIHMLAWVLFVANILWTTAYDTIYAMVDREDDIEIGVRSTAILFGDMDRIAIAILNLSFIAAMIMAGRRAEFGLWYWVGVGVAGLFLAWQQYLIRERDRTACFRAFKNNNLVGLTIFVGLAVDRFTAQGSP